MKTQKCNGMKVALFDSLSAEVSVGHNTYRVKIVYGDESPDTEGRPVYDVEWTSIYPTHLNQEKFQRAVHLSMSSLLEVLVREKLGAFIYQ